MEMPAARISSGSAPASAENQVHVVDHQVQHHIDIQAARAEQVHAVDLEEQRQRDALFEGQNGGVEALQVAHLQDAASARGGLDQAVGGGQIDGDGLFHQDIDPGGEQVAADIGVDRGGRGDDRGVDLAGQVARVGERERSGSGRRLRRRGRHRYRRWRRVGRGRIRGPRGSGSVRKLRRR